MTRLHVHEDDTLIAFLLRTLPEMKRSTVKSRLKHGAVCVNGAAVTRANAALAAGDVVELRREGADVTREGDCPLLFVDDDLAVIEKPSGLLTVPSHRADVDERSKQPS